MELREWLIILGLVLVTIIVIDGIRRLQRQRKVPRLDQADRGADTDDSTEADPEEEARKAEVDWELPNGGARVVRPATKPTVAPKPKLQRQEHPGASKVFRKATSAFRRHDEKAAHPHREPSLGDGAEPSAGHRESVGNREPELTARHEPADSPEPAVRREQPLDESQAAFSAPFEPVNARVPEEDGEAPGEDLHASAHQPTDDETSSTDAPYEDDVVTPHPVVEKARRHHVSAQRARETLAHAEEVIVISVMARNEEGFSGTALLDLMMACGLRYSEMGIFLRYETESPESELQFAMVDVVKPGTFDLEAMDDFSTPGVTFLMPLPGAEDSAAAFEAMVETAMVLVRNLGGALKDENRSVMTAQTVEFARQRVQEFERRNRLHRYQAN